MRNDSDLTVAIRTAMCRNRMTEKLLCKRTGISQATMSRHMGDELWTLEQVRRMHRAMHFTLEEMALFFEGR